MILAIAGFGSAMFAAGFVVGTLVDLIYERKRIRKLKQIGK